MKELILLRHAKSSWNSRALSDIERPLNGRGKEDAPEMGRRLATKDIRPEVIVSSPARRARKTARLVAAQIEYPKGEIHEDLRIYGGDTPELLQVIRQFDDRYSHAMVVGHNPGFTDLSNYLTDERIANVPTCGMVCMEFDIDEWSGVKRGAGRLVFFDFPKNR